MQSGDLDQRIALQSLTETNIDGSLQPSFSTFATVWAFVKHNSGTAIFQSAQVQSWELVKICIRYRADVTTKTRIVWEGQNYNVLSVDRSKRRDGELWITAQVRGSV